MKIPEGIDPEKVKPDSNCPRCYGRGVEGKDVRTGEDILCGCVQKKIRKFSQIKVGMGSEKGKKILYNKI